MAVIKQSREVPSLSKWAYRQATSTDKPLRLGEQNASAEEQRNQFHGEGPRKAFMVDRATQSEVANDRWCILAPVEPSFVGHQQDRSRAASCCQGFPETRQHCRVVETVRRQDYVERIVWWGQLYRLCWCVLVPAMHI